jgi:hypothetical protein
MRRPRLPLALLALAPLPGVLPTPIPIGASAPPVPILSNPTTAPQYLGAPARAHAVRGVLATPRNPFMAPNGRSEIHNDAWQTDAYRWRGPLGRAPVTQSAALNHDCGSIAFDRRGHIVSVCVGVSGPELYMLDANTLATITTFALPPRQKVPSNPFQDFTGGGYFYLDNHDRVVTATTTHHLWVIAENAAGNRFTLARDTDLSHVLTSGEDITSALPDSHGLLWFVTKTDGVVGTVSLTSGRVRTVHLGHGSTGEIENSFATGMHGDVYIATNRRLYRFTAGRGGRPRIVWSVAYPNSHEHKPGQVDDGTGTTPTVMPGGYVNITDNADPMDVVVYRTAPRLRKGQRRLVCRVPVFAKGASATENSLIGAGRMMIVENNYGYTGPSSVNAGASTAPGFARVDLNRSGTGCRRVWTNRHLAAPTVVPKLSLATGLVYAYTKGAGASDPWYWSALDVRTGRTVWQRLAGAGSLGYNNNYAGIAIARTGREYLGTIGGVVALRDG